MSSQLAPAAQPAPATGPAIPAIDDRHGRDDWRVIVVVFWLTSMVEGLGVSQVFAFLPTYLSQMGVPQAERLQFVGLFTSLIFIVGAPLVPLWGVWADKYSRKAVIVRSCLVEAVVFVCVALSREPWQLALSLLLIGFQLGNTGVMLAGIRDVVPRGGSARRWRSSAPPGRSGSRSGRSSAGSSWSTGWAGRCRRCSCSRRCSRSATGALVAIGSREVRPSVVPQGSVLSLAFGAVRGVISDPAIVRIFAIYFVTYLANQLTRPYQPLIVEGVVPAGRVGVGDRDRHRPGGARRGGGGDDRRRARRPAGVPAGARGRARRRRVRAAVHAARTDDRAPRAHRPRVHRVQWLRGRDGLQPPLDRGAAGAPVGDAEPRVPAALRGGIIGPIVGGLVAPVTGPGGPFVLGASVFLIAALVVVFRVRSVRQPAAT